MERAEKDKQRKRKPAARYSQGQLSVTCIQTRKQEVGIARHRWHIPVISEIRRLRRGSHDGMGGSRSVQATE